MPKQKFLTEKYIDRWPDLKEASKTKPSFNPEMHFISDGKSEARHLENDLKWCVDKAYITNSGYILIHGWILDPYRRKSSLSGADLGISLELGYYSLPIDDLNIVRFRRQDVSEQFDIEGNYNFGFLVFLKIGHEIPISNKLSLEIDRTSGITENKKFSVSARLDVDVRICSNTSILKNYFALLDFINESSYSGLASCLNTYDSHHDTLLECWHDHVSDARSHNVLEFGVRNNPAKATFIIVLYSSAELLQPQITLLFSHASKLGVDIILVSNSQEINKQAIDLCHYASELYGMHIRIILMGDNVGFSEANNIAANYVKTDVLALVNPDVFPFYLTDWHYLSLIFDKIPDNQILSPFLHYSDYSVMHSGMTIHKDSIYPPIDENFNAYKKPEKQYNFLLRVDHPYKGMLLDSFETSEDFVETEAVTGGFMIIKRKLYEALDGLSNNYIFGHFEDADFCLRARKKKKVVYTLPKLNFIHLEGKGSKSKQSAISKGVTHFNRCHFTRSHEEDFT